MSLRSVDRHLKHQNKAWLNPPAVKYFVALPWHYLLAGDVQEEWDPHHLEAKVNESAAHSAFLRK